MLHQKSVPMALTILSAALFVSCKSDKTTGVTNVQSVADNSSSPATKALSDLALLESEVELVRLGSVWFDKPNKEFLDSQGISSLKNELFNASIQKSNTWRFDKCEALLALPESSNPKDCAYLLEKTSGAAFEFFLVPANKGKPCTSLSEVCSIHQAVMVKAWNSGIQRPALFVARTPLKLPLAALLVSPPNGDGDTHIALATTTSFPTELANQLSQSLGLGNERLENLIHLSKYWTEKNRKAQLNTARWQAFHIVSLGMSIGGTAGAMSSLGSLHQLTNFGKILLGLDLVSSATSVLSETVTIFDLRKLESQMPQGPSRSTLHAAIMIANAAPWLGATNFGANLVKLSSKILLRAHLIQAFAKNDAKLLAKLSMEAVNNASEIAESRTAHLAETLRNGDMNAAANEINTAISISGATIVKSDGASFEQSWRKWREAKNSAEAKDAIRAIARGSNQVSDFNALRVGSGNCMNASYALIQRLRGQNVSAVAYALPTDAITTKMLNDIAQHMGEIIVKQTPDVENTIEGFEAWLKANLNEGEVALVQSWARNRQTPVGHTTLALKRFGEIIHVNNQYSGDIISTIPMWDKTWKGYFGNAIGYSAFVLGKKILP